MASLSSGKMEESMELVSVEIDVKVAKRLLKHLELAERVPVKFSWSDASEWRLALEDALEQDDA